MTISIIHYSAQHTKTMTFKINKKATYNFEELGVVLKGHQIDSAMERAWDYCLKNRITGDLEAEMQKLTVEYIKSGNY